MRNFTFGHEKSPVIEFQGLSYHYLYGFYMAFVKGSLSHAEMREDIAKDFISGDGIARDFGKMEEDLA